jgi:hypothetical protein
MNAIEGIGGLDGREGHKAYQAISSSVPRIDSRRAVVTGLEHRTTMALTEMSPICVAQSRNSAQALFWYVTVRAISL